MILTSISIYHLRNIAEAVITPAPGVTVFCGDNAQGKTSALEAVFLVTNQRNLRSSSYQDVVQEGAPFLKIILTAEEGGREYEQELRLIREGSRFKKVFLENGSPKTRAKRDLFSASVFFGPAEMRLLSGPPSRRRSYLDAILTATDPKYARAYNTFEKIIRQRNRHLKGLSLRNAAADQLLSIYDEQLVRPAAYLWNARARLAPELIPLVSDRLRMFWRGKEASKPTLEYRAAIDVTGGEAVIAERHLKTLQRARPKELQRGVTISGPQHDDLFCSQGEHEFAERASQGEMKAVVFALMSAQAAIIRDRTGTAPVFLLDDIHAEFDFQYQRDIPLLCDGFQTLVTTTSRPAAGWGASEYLVAGGSFTPGEGGPDDAK